MKVLLSLSAAAFHIVNGLEGIWAPKATFLLLTFLSLPDLGLTKSHYIVI